MNRKITFTEGEFYHVYNRGADKRIIFNSDKDKDRFQRLLYIANGERPFLSERIPASQSYEFERGEALVDIGAYCLMQNHFHLLLRERIPGGITMFMRKLSTAYTMYFNKRYDRTGVLFEGAFKATHADTDRYLKYLFAYIHLNPVKFIDPKWKEDGVKDPIATQVYLNDYPHSSYIDYKAKMRSAAKILNKREFPNFFEDAKDFNIFIDEWLNFHPD